MSKAIQSATYPDYFKLSDLALGIKIAKWRIGARRPWGKLRMIEFLISLGERWDLSHRDSPPPILIGDISPEGGASPARDAVGDHSSHKSGEDVDIYVFRKDGKPERTSTLDKAQYDGDRMTQLARHIIFVANSRGITIEKFYFNDKEVQKVSSTITAWPNHEDHLHLRLKTT